MAWACERVETDDVGPEVWRVYDTGDSSYEATICEFWSGEHDNARLAREMCDQHNTAGTPRPPRVLEELSIPELQAEIGRLQLALIRRAVGDMAAGQSFPIRPC